MYCKIDAEIEQRRAEVLQNINDKIEKISTAGKRRVRVENVMWDTLGTEATFMQDSDPMS